MYIPPTYPLLRKLPVVIMHSNKISENQEGRHGIQETADPTQKGSEGKSQAESCTAGLKSSHSRLEQEDGGGSRRMSLGENMDSRQQVA